MNPREIIAKAWEIAKKEKRIRRWGFAESLLETLLNVKLLIYQVWFAYSFFITKDPISPFTMEKVIIDFFPNKVVAWSVVGFLFFLLFVEWVFPHFARGAIIGLAAKSYRKEEVKGGLVLGVYNFFPIFAAHEMLVLSGITTVATLASLALRYLGDAAIIGIFLIISLWVFSTVLEFFWVFVEEAIVVRKLGLKKALGSSFKLVISYLGHIVFLMLLLFFIILRVFANLLMVSLVPGVVIALGFLLTRFLPDMVSYTISGVMGLVIIVLASYFFAYLEVFRQTVWTITYIELSNLKELDVIEQE